ncbi:substrate-binding domain-containing protein [Miniimonas arenae]|uniref:Substrate-binding domain-containing protein n=1 Tax=Miniimonas arenae TaxID=676201 RepID=A0A5C5BEP9_9MICO|nr:LacI family DNA-binding transcriptional regulator [Miniimonas arenae]TNU76089.1 substrate-binding domain-containing protein [Miniimonas arenae]
MAGAGQTEPGVDVAFERQVVTLRDVADAAGVSVSTASRVLDERGPRSRSASADRVRRAADELGYRRNAIAAGLRRGATGTIGMLVPRLSDTVMAVMYEAVESAARARGFMAVVATSGDDPQDEARATETLLDRNVDGLVLATARFDDSLPASLRERGIPHVLVLRTDGVSASSLGDDETGGYLATRHLLDLGHERVAVVAGPAFTSTARSRLAGARRALTERGLEAPAELVGHAPTYGVDDGVLAGERLFALPAAERPTAVFAANDNLAIGVMSAAYRAGQVPGQDVAIVGYNDIPFSRRMPVPLSSVLVPYDHIAATALDLLAEHGEPRIERAMPTLIPRASSGAPLRGGRS